MSYPIKEGHTSEYSGLSTSQLGQLSGQTDINMETGKRKYRRIGHTLRKDDEQP
jgi:hypothetical protein